MKKFTSVCLGLVLVVMAIVVTVVPPKQTDIIEENPSARTQPQSAQPLNSSIILDVTFISYELESYAFEQTIESVEATTTANTYYTASDFKYLGVIDYNNYRWTWYSQRVLPGGGLDIPGRHVDEDGYVCDEEDYICLASCDLPKGTIIDTPLGKQGKIYDYCLIPGIIDTYVDW